MIEKIKEIARANGACELRDMATNWDELAQMLFSPQGREFCHNKNFPDILTWRKIKISTDIQKYNIYVDSGSINLENPKTTALIGLTNADIHCYGSSISHKIFLQHCAKARISLIDYAVVILAKGHDCEVKIENDGTGIIIYE